MKNKMRINCLYDKLVSVSEIKFHPKNRNKHPESQIKRLAKILEYQGWRYPVKISKQSGFVTSGHGRVEAAKINGWDKVPVNFQSYENADQEYADLQADNAIANWAELDIAAIQSDLGDLDILFDAELLGIQDLESKAKNGLIDDDAVPETPKKPKSKSGDLYLLGEHRLLCGDSTDREQVERLMAGEKADMVFTDPPYGVNERTMRKSAGRGKLAKGHDFRPVIGDDSNQTAILAFDLCNELTTGTLIFWGANYYAKALPEVSSWIVWDKRDGVASDDNADCELAWCSNKKPARVFRHLWKGSIRVSEKNETKVHPTQKPIALAEWCFENYGEPKNVLDLFGGSGSTLIACEKTGRKCFMMEIDPHYIDVIVERWENYTGLKAKLSKK